MCVCPCTCLQGGLDPALLDHTLPVCKHMIPAAHRDVQAELACPSFCGYFGKCAVVGATAGCVCECGWAGACRG